LSSQFLQARASAQTQIRQFQQAISHAEQRGMNVSAYRLQLNEDLQEFQGELTSQAYAGIAGAVQTQAAALELGLTRYDLQELGTLIGQTKITNDYEYRDAVDAYGDQRLNFQYAQTPDDYRQVATQAETLVTNLSALLANLSDRAPHDEPHATDLELIQDYQLTGKVIVVSLTEQTLREYDNGQLVGWIYVVTGQRAAQTPPGLWHVIMKGTNLTFKSPDPPGSALWYPPTHINYGLLYHDNGYFLHDAPWRSYFGPGANLPHDDYTSGQYSDTGTHGCINMTLDDTIRLYNWARVGTPVLVY
jgi:lipoprotein-anchoring transpeptidase ErfK/SrfK